MNDWTYGTILRHPRIHYLTYMFIARTPRADDFYAMVVTDEGGRRPTTWPRSGSVVICGGRPDDEEPWIVVND